MWRRKIEIDTKESHRREGLAAACGASLILKCLKRDKYPSWDAIDLRAEEYITYFVTFS